MDPNDSGHLKELFFPSLLPGGEILFLEGGLREEQTTRLFSFNDQKQQRPAVMYLPFHSTSSVHPLVRPLTPALPCPLLFFLSIEQRRVDMRLLASATRERVSGAFDQLQDQTRPPLPLCPPDPDHAV